MGSPRHTRGHSFLSPPQPLTHPSGHVSLAASAVFGASSFLALAALPTPPVPVTLGPGGLTHHFHPLPSVPVPPMLPRPATCYSQLGLGDV